MADYFRSLPRMFPLANALRFRSGFGRIHGAPRSTYCPECRRALQAWCESMIAADAPEAWIARLVRDQLFADPSAA